MDYIKLFDAILELTLTGSILAIIMLLVRQLVKKNISKTIVYYMWVILLIKLLIPFGFESKLSIYNLFKVENSIIENKVNNQDSVILNNNSITLEENKVNNSSISTESNSTEEKLINDKSKNLSSNIISNESNLNKTKESIKEISFFIWIIGVALLLTYTLIKYVLFVITVNKESRNMIYDKDISLTLEGINSSLKDVFEIIKLKKNIKVVLSNKVSAPTLCGVINPKILIPTYIVNNISKEELKYILLHELCHHKRRDIILAWIITFTKIIYWFNPIIIFALNTMRKDCEISCDEKVLSYLNKNENLNYGNTILNILQYVNKASYITGTTSMVTNKKNLKERITNIAKNKSFGFKSILVGITIILIIAVVGLTNRVNGKSVKLSIDNAQVNSILVKAMPSPPKQKNIDKEEDIKSVIEYLNSINLKEKKQEKYKGWEFYISIKGLEEHNITIVGNCLRFDEIEYNVSEEEVEKFRELYKGLSYDETPIVDNNQEYKENKGYKEFTEKVEADGYKVLMNSGFGYPIMLPKSFGAVKNGIEIGKLLKEVSYYEKEDYDNFSSDFNNNFNFYFL